MNLLCYFYQNYDYTTLRNKLFESKAIIVLNRTKIKQQQTNFLIIYISEKSLVNLKWVPDPRISFKSSAEGQVLPPNTANKYAATTFISAQSHKRNPSQSVSHRERERVLEVEIWMERWRSCAYGLYESTRAVLARVRNLFS